MLISFISMSLPKISTSFSKIIWWDLKENIKILSLVKLLMLMELNILQMKYKYILLVKNIKSQINLISWTYHLGIRIWYGNLSNPRKCWRKHEKSSCFILLVWIETRKKRSWTYKLELVESAKPWNSFSCRFLRRIIERDEVHFRLRLIHVPSSFLIL